MNIEIFALCDAATNQQGKLNILGAFDTIFAKAEPVVQAQCAAALRIRFNRIEAGKHKIRIGLVDPDGKAVVPPLEAEVGVAGQGDSAAANIVLNFARLGFPRFGTYQLDLAVNGKQERSLPVYVRKAPQVGRA